MEWLSENLFWTLVFIVFLGMHLFGHGCHGKHNHDAHNHDHKELSDEKKKSCH